MDRLAFLKEMKTSLVKTVQSAFAPIVEDKIEKIDRSIDVISQLKWVFVTADLARSKSIETKYLVGQTLILIYSGEKLQAFSGTCPNCQQLLHIFQVDATCKCMSCDQYFSFTSDDNGALEQYPTKQMQDGYYVGIRSNRPF